MRIEDLEARRAEADREIANLVRAVPGLEEALRADPCVWPKRPPGNPRLRLQNEYRWLMRLLYKDGPRVKAVARHLVADPRELTAVDGELWALEARGPRGLLRDAIRSAAAELDVSESTIERALNRDPLGRLLFEPDLTYDDLAAFREYRSPKAT